MYAIYKICKCIINAGPDVLYMKMFDMNLVLPDQYTNTFDHNLTFLDKHKNV